MNDTIDTFWSEYNALNYNNGLFDCDDFIWSSKYIWENNIHIWNQKYSLPSTKVLDFVECRVTSIVIGIVADVHSWGDVNTIKSDKRSAISSGVSEMSDITLMRFLTISWKNRVLTRL